VGLFGIYEVLVENIEVRGKRSEVTGVGYLGTPKQVTAFRRFFAILDL
jgi:hypothetical protein